MQERDVAEVFAAAVVSASFEEGFVDPQKRAETLQKGYLDIPFSLTEEETKVILEAAGKTLPEIAASVCAKLGYNIDANK